MNYNFFSHLAITKLIKGFQRVWHFFQKLKQNKSCRDSLKKHFFHIVMVLELGLKF